MRFDDCVLLRNLINERKKWNFDCFGREVKEKFENLIGLYGRRVYGVADLSWAKLSFTVSEDWRMPIQCFALISVYYGDTWIGRILIQFLWVMCFFCLVELMLLCCFGLWDCRFRWRQQYRRRYPDELLDKSNARWGLEADYFIGFVTWSQLHCIWMMALLLFLIYQAHLWLLPSVLIAES